MPITINGTGTITGISAGGLPDGTVQPADLSTGGPYWDTSGNVGVGTTSPTSKLHVHTAGSSYSIVQITNGDTGSTVNDGLHIGMDNNGTTAAFNIRDASGVLVFRTQDAERARIDSSGNFLVGTTSLVDFGKISINFASTGPNIGIGIRQTNSGAGTMLNFLNSSGTTVGNITHNGSNAAYNTSSDYRLKENVQPMTGALAKVAALKPCTYTWKADGEAGQGFIAHELAEVVPDAVTGEKDAVNEDGTIKPQGIDTSFLVATLTAAIQELKAIVDAQAVEIAALKGATQ